MEIEQGGPPASSLSCRQTSDEGRGRTTDEQWRKMSVTKVYYIIPEDGDEESHPNMFVVNAPPQQVRLGDVRAAFPLKKHAYHFRFKKPFQNKFVWLDCVDLNAPLPMFDGYYFCKVSRLGELSGSTATSAPRQVPAQSRPAETVKPSAAQQSRSVARAPEQPSIVAPMPSNSDLFEWTDMDAAPAATAPSSSPSEPKAPTPLAPHSDDLLDFLGGASSSAPAPSPPPASSGLEDFAWDSAFQSAPAPSASAPVGVGLNNSFVQPVKKTSGKLPNELGAEAAKNFSL